MLEPITGLADGTIGFRTIGKVEADDYRNFLNPALDSVLENHDQVNFVYVVSPDFDGYSLGALWQDTKEITRGFSVWNRVAFVSDVEWMNHVVPTAAHLISGEVKVFSLSDEAAAIAWANGEV
ncbi:MAG: STAS/SEC14 domain-containing protein [Solirubrobacterales bacterium]